MPVMSGEGCGRLDTAHFVDIRQYWAVKVATLKTTSPRVVTYHWPPLLQERCVPNDTPGLSFDALAMSTLDYGNDSASLGKGRIFG